MDRLRELLRNIWMRIVAALKNFENSATFERIMRKYESLSRKNQNLVGLLLQALGIMALAVLILGGPFLLLFNIQTLHTLEHLEADAQAFQAEVDSRTKGFSPPSGLKAMPSSSAGELAENFNEYLLTTGVPEQYGTLVAMENKLNLTLKEISIRQATNILFQLEGLFPKVRGLSFNARPNTSNPQILDVEGTFEFNPAYVNQFAGGSTVPMTEPESEPSAQPTSRSNVGGPTRSAPTEGNNPNDPNFQNDYVPTAPPPGDFEEFSPPDIPDDLPPPPPPTDFGSGEE